MSPLLQGISNEISFFLMNVERRALLLVFHHPALQQEKDWGLRQRRDSSIGLIPTTHRLIAYEVCLFTSLSKLSLADTLPQKDAS